MLDEVSSLPILDLSNMIPMDSTVTPTQVLVLLQLPFMDTTTPMEEPTTDKQAPFDSLHDRVPRLEWSQTLVITPSGKVLPSC